MSKNSRQKRELRKLEQAGVELEQMPTDLQEYKEGKNAVTPKSFEQRQYMNVLLNMEDDLVVGIGRAGTGKTWMATMIAAKMYKENHYRQLILTRPTEECGNDLGALPGELYEKFAPYLEPFKQVLVQSLGGKFHSDLHKTIIPMPLQYMRGASYDHAIMLCDEAQNMTVEQMKMFLTRAGVGTKIIITGDVNQSDLEDKSRSGLAWLVHQIRQRNLPEELIELKQCVRSDLCKRMLDIIDKEV